MNNTKPTIVYHILYLGLQVIICCTSYGQNASVNILFGKELTLKPSLVWNNDIITKSTEEPKYVKQTISDRILGISITKQFKQNQFVDIGLFSGTNRKNFFFDHGYEKAQNFHLNLNYFVSPSSNENNRIQYGFGVNTIVRYYSYEYQPKEPLKNIFDYHKENSFTTSLGISPRIWWNFNNDRMFFCLNTVWSFMHFAYNTYYLSQDHISNVLEIVGRLDGQLQLGLGYKINKNKELKSLTP